MADDLRERLLASYADMGEAMVVQNVLESAGVACRVGDLANVAAHMLGIAGPMRRSVGLWVLEADVERATAILSTLSTEAAVDEEALAAEALAAAPPEGGAAGDAEAPAGDAAAGTAPAGRREAGVPRLVPVLFLVVPLLAWLLASRGCE